MNRKPSKTHRPADYDNSWLGIMGVTGVTLYNKNGKRVGYCMDTPNAIAQVMRNHPEVITVKNAFGEVKTRREYTDRMEYANVPHDGYRAA